MHPQRESNVLEHVQIGKQRTALKQHAHVLARIKQITARQGRQVLIVDPHFAAVGTQLHAHQAQQCGLAAARRPHDPRDLATRDANIDIIEDAARTALEGHSLQLDRVGVIGAHLNSLRCSLCLSPGHQTSCEEARVPWRAELAANYTTAHSDRPRPKECRLSLSTVK